MTIAKYRDPSTPIEERVTDLLDQMTIEEKIGQMMQLGANREGMLDKLEEWHIGSYLHCTDNMPNELQARAAKTRLGIPLLFGIDAIHGHCFENTATVFPSQLGLSCSWNNDLIKKMAEVTAKETRACGLHWTFSPVLCVARDTRWGRVDETFGEDPWLIGELGAAMIEGYQGEDLSADNTIMACAKHYVAYGETKGGRDAYEASIPKRELLSLFLPPFEKAVKKAHVASLMAGYQSIDGVPCSADTWLMRELPKNDWGMDGFIVTDWNNIGSLHDKQHIAENQKDAAYLALLAGNDMIMSTPEFYDAAVELVKEQRIPSAIVDDSVRRILRYKFKLGLCDASPMISLDEKKHMLGQDAHWQLALNASQQSITLLKNDGALPLQSKFLNKILLVGPNADDVFAQLGDWSFGSMQAAATNDTLHKDDTVTPLQALLTRSETDGFDVEYVKGADCLDHNVNEINKAVDAAVDADVIIACVGDTIAQHGEFHDRADLMLSGQQTALLKALKHTNKPIITVFIASKPLAIGWLKENTNALVCAFNPGAKGGQAISDILFGDINPSGKLTISFPHSAGQLPVYYNKYSGWHATLSAHLDGEERYIDLPENPVFSFGEGLSYTQFHYSNLTVLTPQLENDQTLHVQVTLTNIGKLTGTEIVQLYINDVFSSVTTPIKNLRSYKRVTLAAGESLDIRLSVDYWDLALINRALQKVVEPGTFDVMVGASSKDADLLKAQFRVK